MREYAVSKLAPNSEVTTFTFINTLSYSNTTSPDEILLSLHIGYTSYRHVVFSHPSKKLGGHVILVDDDFSEYSSFYDGSAIRFKKNGSTLEVYVNPQGDFDTITNLNITVF